MDAVKSIGTGFSNTNTPTSTDVKRKSEESSADKSVQNSQVQQAISAFSVASNGKIISPNAEDKNVKEKDEDKKLESEMTFEEAEKAAEKLRNAVNKTEVKFDVSIQQSGESAFSFQVVEKESGRVVRQYPPDELVDVLKKVDGNVDVDSGVLVDDVA